MTRIIDIVVSGIAMVILFPFMLPIMIGLKLTGVLVLASANVIKV